MLPEIWDEECQFNIKDIGNNLIHNIKTFNHNSHEQIDWIYTDIYRFLCEYEFMIKKGYELSRNLQIVKNQIEDDNAAIDIRARADISYLKLSC